MASGHVSTRCLGTADRDGASDSGAADGFAGVRLLPTALVNTFYAWPKMLATAYLLLTFTLLFCRPVQNDAERVPAGILIGGLAGLAFLSHGTSAFALVGFAVTVIVFWAWPSLKAMVAGGVTLVSLCLPWTLYQNIIDPPGNRLMKWHLAGVEAVDKRGFLTTLRESYGGLSWSEFADAKRQNLQIPVRGWPEHLADLARLMAGDTSGLDRIAQRTFQLPAIAALCRACVDRGACGPPVYAA